VLELVNQYPQEFDDAIPLFHRHSPLYIVGDRVEADLGIIESKLQEKNCLAAGEWIRQKNRNTLELQQTVF
jgi:TatD DNase family protein